MKFTDNYIKSSSQPIHLIQCKDEKDIDCYYFLMCPSYALDKLRTAEEEILDLNNFGVIVHSGFGAQPTLEDIEFLKEKYNYKS